MKNISFFLFTILSFDLTAQDKILGQYRDYFGNHILLNSDKTFKYTWNFDMQASWSKGTWKLKNDTIVFKMVPTYDTLSKKYNDTLIDSLVLSVDEIPERLKPKMDVNSMLYSGGQNIRDYPDTLLFRKGRLYKINNGKLLTKKQSFFWGAKKKWNPWYFKSAD